MNTFSGYTVGIFTLGCKVNQYESEAISERFAADGFRILPPTEKCDVYVVNTCTVTAESDRKCRQMIRRVIKRNPAAYILVTGCLSQVNPGQISAIEGVDYVCGNAGKQSVVKEAERLILSGVKRQSDTKELPAPDSCGFEKMEITRFDRTRAYIKICDGCESRCAYCIIPTARGKIRSKAPEDVLREAAMLTAGGCRELVLTGIETASYGKDLDGYDLADLLTGIDAIDGVGRVRLGSLDPSLMKQSFVDRLAGLSSLAPHFHLSMQSGSDTVLARMRRKYNTKMALDGMERLRAILPDVQFTTDMIVGFPGETEEEFEETLRFAQKARFLMIHVFPYSRRAGTVADRMDAQVPEEIKHRRVRILSEVEKTIREEILGQSVGTEATVLFETYEDGIASGHTPNFFEVHCPADESLRGEIRTVRLTGIENDGFSAVLIQ